jgi:hypothetical protein
MPGPTSSGAVLVQFLCNLAGLALWLHLHWTSEPPPRTDDNQFLVVARHDRRKLSSKKTSRMVWPYFQRRFELGGHLLTALTVSIIASLPTVCAILPNIRSLPVQFRIPDLRKTQRSRNRSANLSGSSAKSFDGGTKWKWESLYWAQHQQCAN